MGHITLIMRVVYFVCVLFFVVGALAEWRPQGTAESQTDQDLFDDVFKSLLTQYGSDVLESKAVVVHDFCDTYVRMKNINDLALFLNKFVLMRSARNLTKLSSIRQRRKMTFASLFLTHSEANTDRMLSTKSPPLRKSMSIRTLRCKSLHGMNHGPTIVGVSMPCASNFPSKHV